MTHFDWIEKWALYTPHKTVFREYKRNLEWSYEDFNKRVSNLALYLRDMQKIQKGDRIAVYSKNRAEYVFLFFACIKIGAILVPLNFRLTPREIEMLFHDAGPAVLFYEKDYSDQVANLGKTRIEIEKLETFLINQPNEGYVKMDHTNENDVVMILYTSGTTGVPKGAMITHKMLYWNSVNTTLRLDITSADHTQSYAPFFHTGGWNVLLTPFVHHGASHTILSEFDTDLLLQLIEKEKSTILFGVPTMLQMMADSPLFDKTDLSSVRYAVVGGAPMPKPLIDIWHEKGIFIRQGYGLTEVGPNCFSLHHDDAIIKKGSIGFPNFYIDAKVMSDNKECAVNEIGELCLKSPVVTPGYWRNPKTTKETITDDWFHTGDMVQFDDEGYYYVMDRKKNMFISGGENVYPAEVEKFLYTHPGIKEVAVTGVPDQKWGEVGKAFVVLKKENISNEQDILDFCGGNLAKYKIPKYVQLIEELPKNAAGKIDRLKLK